MGQVKELGERGDNGAPLQVPKNLEMELLIKCADISNVLAPHPKHALMEMVCLP